MVLKLGIILYDYAVDFSRNVAILYSKSRSNIIIVIDYSKQKYLAYKSGPQICKTYDYAIPLPVVETKTTAGQTIYKFKNGTKLAETEKNGVCIAAKGDFLRIQGTVANQYTIDDAVGRFTSDQIHLNEILAICKEQE